MIPLPWCRPQGLWEQQPIIVFFHRGGVYTKSVGKPCFDSPVGSQASSNALLWLLLLLLLLSFPNLSARRGLSGAAGVRLQDSMQGSSAMHSPGLPGFHHRQGLLLGANCLGISGFDHQGLVGFGGAGADGGRSLHPSAVCSCRVKAAGSCV